MLLELWQAQCHEYCRGESVPVPDHTLGEEPLPNTQPEPSLLHIHTVKDQVSTVALSGLSD